jgi:hypothetical protein
VSFDPLVVSYGMGVDSTALLIGLHQRGERPDLILTADTGDEKPETYAYVPIMQEYLARIGFPPIVIVKNPRPKAGDKSLSEAVMRLGVLPALAYGAHQCSLVWKLDPQHAYMKRWQLAKAAWARGGVVINCIGYDAGPRDSCRQYKAEGKARQGFQNRFPLIEWGWTRERCIEEIQAAGLPVPVKSACFHCPASKKAEIVWLREQHPHLYERALLMERTAEPYHERRRAEGKNAARGLGRTFSWANV